MTDKSLGQIARKTSKHEPVRSVLNWPACKTKHEQIDQAVAAQVRVKALACQDLTDDDIDQIITWQADCGRGDIGFQGFCDKIIKAFSTQSAATAQSVGCDDAWISVLDRLPECDQQEGSFGVEVFIWPPHESGGTAFFGKRYQDESGFYKYGTILTGITHWSEVRLPTAPPQTKQSEGL